ncbi:DUF5928 domain-containing protein [Limimaricola pyoseonensis]|uniref:Peptide O-xylosyltransferase n=1 Tax=Limimaricola pyoseonensis TaxID=521013 RepID=A0A1G7BZH0_9RHOB|nr:DUF5928 domain-containing protein [Limimaricola pyoseonensis]SDE32439.1 Core-2/I-Branching enzyme [Limimaricola pyoseonensis]
MARIAFILLCHGQAAPVIAQARALVASGDAVAIHLDARAPRAEWARLRDAFRGAADVALVPDRLRCGWGEWSLVAATLRAARLALARFPDATHLYTLSGDCLPVRPARDVHALLDAAPRDRIESTDLRDGGWVRIGLGEERLTRWHLVNERRRKRLFYALLGAQRRLGIARTIPADIRPMIGAQWWCLRRATLAAVLDFADRRPDVVRLFRHSWIPDESFVQTLVRRLVPAAEIENRSPTFHAFSDYGLPAVFHDDQRDFLLGQDAFFARKAAAGAAGLRADLGRIWSAGGPGGPGGPRGTEGRAQLAYLARRGRVGQRHAPRAWEAGGEIGAGRELTVIACRRFDLGKRLAGRLKRHCDWPVIDYAFDEAACPLPDLGGIESSLDKRQLHRRNFLRLLFEVLGTRRLAVCVDPKRLDVLGDLAGADCGMRLLEIDGRMGEARLAAHARRLGLLGPATPPGVAAEMLAAMRRDMAAEDAALRGLGLPRHYRLAETAARADNLAAVTGALGVPLPAAEAILDPPGLFDD